MIQVGKVYIVHCAMVGRVEGLVALGRAVECAPTIGTGRGRPVRLGRDCWRVRLLVPAVHDDGTEQAEVVVNDFALEEPSVLEQLAAEAADEGETTNG